MWTHQYEMMLILLELLLSHLNIYVHPCSLRQIPLGCYSFHDLQYSLESEKIRFSPFFYSSDFLKLWFFPFLYALLQDMYLIKTFSQYRIYHLTIFIVCSSYLVYWKCKYLPMSKLIAVIHIKRNKHSIHTLITCHCYPQQSCLFIYWQLTMA